MDYTGKYGVGPNTFYIPFKTFTQGKRIEAFLNSEYYKTIALACKTSRQFLKIGFVEHLNLDKIMNTEYNSKNKTKKQSKGKKQSIVKKNKTKRNHKL